MKSQGWGIRPESGLDFQKPLAGFGRWPGGEHDILLQQVGGIMAVVPTEADCQHGLFVAVFLNQPFLLADSWAGLVGPEINPFDRLVGEPNGKVVVMVGGARMPDARQGPAGGTDQRIKKRPRRVRAGMPAGHLAAINDEGESLMRSWFDAATRRKGHLLSPPNRLTLAGFVIYILTTLIRINFIMGWANHHLKMVGSNETMRIQE